MSGRGRAGSHRGQELIKLQSELKYVLLVLGSRG